MENKGAWSVGERVLSYEYRFATATFSHRPCCPVSTLAQLQIWVSVRNLWWRLIRGSAQFGQLSSAIIRDLRKITIYKITPLTYIVYVIMNIVTQPKEAVPLINNYCKAALGNWARVSGWELVMVSTPVFACRGPLTTSAQALKLALQCKYFSAYSQ